MYIYRSLIYIHTLYIYTHYIYIYTLYIYIHTLYIHIYLPLMLFLGSLHLVHISEMTFKAEAHYHYYFLSL